MKANSKQYKLEYLLQMYDKFLYIETNSSYSKKQCDRLGTKLYKVLSETLSDPKLLGRISKYDNGILQKYERKGLQ